MPYALGSPSGLTAEDERLLWARYIHLSAHWTPSKGLLLNKLAPNRRVACNNSPYGCNTGRTVGAIGSPGIYPATMWQSAWRSRR
jgi:hypothetical protein